MQLKPCKSAYRCAHVTGASALIHWSTYNKGPLTHIAGSTTTSPLSYSGQAGSTTITSANGVKESACPAAHLEDGLPVSHTPLESLGHALLLQVYMLPKAAFTYDCLVWASQRSQSRPYKDCFASQRDKSHASILNLGTYQTAEHTNKTLAIHSSSKWDIVESAAYLEDLVQAAANVRGRHLAVVQGHGDRCERDCDAQKYSSDDEHCQIERCACYYHAQVKEQARYQHCPLAPVFPVPRRGGLSLALLMCQGRALFTGVVPTHTAVTRQKGEPLQVQISP